MAIQRHYLDQLMLSLFDKEATYDAGPGGWANTQACSMLEFGDASAHEEWPDTVVRNDDTVGQEFAKRQELVRQDVRLVYEEPRAKPNSLAGLLALGLGTVTSTQDAALTAYRHKITKAAQFSMPSIGAQVKHENGRQYKYTGIKSDGFTIAAAEAYFRLSSSLIGSGSRATAADAFAASISEDWLRWGDAKVFVKPTSGTAITIPATPSQGAVNLGASNVELSSRVLELSGVWNNGQQGPLGYRAGSGKVKQNLHPGRRNGQVTLKIEVDDATEAAELDYYLNQTKLAFELNVDSGVVVATGGAFKFGLILIVPLIQFETRGRENEGEREALNFVGRIMDDGTNSEVVGFVYNAQSTYLA